MIMAVQKTRISADERREEILQAAMEEFARGGLDGTSTDSIARRVGISQPYLFRLFGTKKALFLEVVERCFNRTLKLFQDAANGYTGEEALSAMGDAYTGRLADRVVLLAQLQAYAACDDQDVRAAVRTGFKRLALFVGEATGADSETIRSFFEKGMLMNVVAAIELDKVDEPWANDLVIWKSGAHKAARESVKG
jgi:AcrR family transcriptional regulator